jgi:hypothetical protein
VNAVHLFRDRAWNIDELRAAWTRSGLVVEDAASERVVVFYPEVDERVYVGTVTELDYGLRTAFGDADTARLLEIEYASLILLTRVLQGVRERRQVVVDNNHGFHGPLSKLLALMAERPEWDWRSDSRPQGA